MSEILEGLNPSQLQAVTHTTGPLLIVAGAGTGKTTVLTRRYVHLMQSRDLTTENILALTFTEKAAGEMEDRILQMLPNGAYDFWIGTFHGICQRILEEHGLEIGIPNRFRVVTETDGWLLLRRHLAELPLDHYRPLGNPVRFLNELLRHFSRAKDEGVTPERYHAFVQDLTLDGDEETARGERARLKEIADCYAMYQKILRDEGALDFGDIILETLRLLRERPHVLAELRSRFAEVLVDEFQDTNWAQYELIKLLGGTERNITVVGDDDQAIYKFRGASLANILQFRDDFPDATTVYLTENYRSRQEVLDAAYACIAKNDPNRLEVRLKDTGLVKRLTAAAGAGGDVEALWFRTLEDEADGVARRILELKRQDPDLAWNGIAVLSRSNDGALPFVRALERHGIPFRFYALRGLYAKPLVVDLTAVFSLLDGTREPSAVWRVLTSPWVGIPAEDIAKLIRYADRVTYRSLWTALEHVRVMQELSPTTVAAVEKLVAAVQALSESALRETPLRILQRAVEKLSVLKHVMSLPEQEKLDGVGLLNGFANRIRRYEQSTHAPTLRGFMEDFRLEIDSGEEGALGLDPDEGPDLVKVLTVHASKGLEFDHVFVVSLVDQRFPTRARHEAIPLPDGLVNERLPEGDAHLEEERRLFYVAVTRARKGVTLTGAESYGGTRKKKPSVFIGDLGIDTSVLPL
ncbi:ATP-dependent helicase, partial [Patescibacteria group bacterium]|nr:ATP-dependent helicase [Patescibacteria group bacterium]MBU1448604.1 ATP-dependent helicase [Patescibacteria group bacterium]